MTYEYVGTELDLFAQATNWKRYLKSVVSPFLTGDVLEVGAGIGTTTRAFSDGSASTWLCLEPDGDLAERARAGFEKIPVPASPSIRSHPVQDLDADRDFDCILYVDVLEHIEHDGDELARAQNHLRPDGHLVVIGPAHQWLFSEFDEAVGHFRRYSRASLRAVVPAGMDQVMLRYMDALGVALSAANRVLLRASTPTVGQIKTWDSAVVPLSRLVDPLLFWRAGKSVVGVWRQR